MKRTLLRISAVSAVALLGLVAIAIAYAQRSAVSSDDAADSNRLKPVTSATSPTPYGAYPKDSAPPGNAYSGADPFQSRAGVGETPNKLGAASANALPGSASPGSTLPGNTLKPAARSTGAWPATDAGAKSPLTTSGRKYANDELAPANLPSGMDASPLTEKSPGTRYPQATRLTSGEEKDLTGPAPATKYGSAQAATPTRAPSTYSSAAQKSAIENRTTSGGLFPKNNETDNGAPAPRGGPGYPSVYGGSSLKNNASQTATENGAAPAQNSAPQNGALPGGGSRPYYNDPATNNSPGNSLGNNAAPAQLQSNAPDLRTAQPLANLSADESNGPTSPAIGGTEGTGRPGPRELDGAQAPQVAVEKVAPTDVQVGKPARFEIKVRNTGNGTAQGIEIHDEVPKGTTLLSTSPPANTGARGDLVWSLGSLKPGEEVVAVLEVMPVVEGEIGSVASVQIRANASARATVTKPELTLQVTGTRQIMIGDDVTLAIKITNPGSGVASGVVLEERVPQGMKHQAGTELEFEVGTLKPGESRTYDLTMHAAGAGKMTNMISARGDANLRAQEKTELEVIAPSLQISMTGPSRRYLERQATYTVNIDNPGTAPARDVQLVTHLPKGMKFVKANNAGHYDAQTHSVVWSLEELPAKESGSVQLVALPIEAGEQHLKTEGKAREGLTDEKDQTVVVEGLAALMFSVADAEDPIELNGETTYEIRVTNQGSKQAGNVQLTASLPAEMKFVSAEGPTRHAQQGQQVVFEPLARLGAKTDTIYRVRCQALKAGDVRLRVQLRSDDLREPVTKEESTRVYADE